MSSPRIVPTAEQKRVLDLGPTSIRIRAGAGTGKTTTVGLIISNLVTEHGFEPERILGITFTNKAASELGDKVREALAESVDPARQVEVHTYHGFAAQILAEFGAIVGFDNRARVITPTFARQILTDTFHRRGYDHLDMTWSGTIDKIRQLADRIGDHLVEPATLIEQSRNEDDPVWLARAEIAETLVSYQSEKAKLGVVDYTDLVSGSVRVMTEHPELARIVRDRYRVVVLDEYQDTNPAQRVLLTTIFGDGFPVIAVGDEDQTIYEWRGASAENFELFPAHFPTAEGRPAHDLGLRLNRRSAPEILSLANDVRRRANADSEPLESAHVDLAGGIFTYWATDALEEADWTGARFEELRAEGTPWREMAVLLRKNKDFPIFIDAMSRRDIPVEVANVGGLLSVPEVSELRAWLTILENPDDSIALTQILFGSRFRLGMADIAPLSRRAGIEEADADAETPTPVTLLEAIESTESISGLRQEAAQALGRFNAIYRAVLIESQGLSLIETLRLILDHTRAWQDVEALPPNPRLTARLNIYRFLDLAEDWSPVQRPSLGAFLDYLSVMEGEPAEELDSAHLSGEDAVTLITVHRAKGLEWDCVAIPTLAKGNFPNTAGQFPDPLRFPESLPPHLRIDTVIDGLPADREERDAFLRARRESQEWRTAYVAVTRARRTLLMTGAYWYGLPETTKKPKQPSELFEIADANDHAVSLGRAESGERPTFLKSAPESSAPDPLFRQGWTAALREGRQSDTLSSLAARIGVAGEYERKVEETTQLLFELARPAEEPEADGARSASVTSLVSFAQCPKRYYWTEVDPLPRRPHPAAAYGTQVHRQIELHQRGHVPFEVLADDLYDLVPAEEGSEGDGVGGFHAYLESRFAERRATLVETPFSLAVGDDFTIRGRMDAVYTDGAHWEIVDFKSGRPSTDPSRLVQLKAYAVAAHEVDFGPPRPERLEVAFAYLGGGLTEQRFEADDEWVRSARDEIGEMAARIAAEEFHESPGDWCKSCDFLQFCGPGQEWMA